MDVLAGVGEFLLQVRNFVLMDFSPSLFLGKFIPEMDVRLPGGILELANARFQLREPGWLIGIHHGNNWYWMFEILYLST